MATHIGKCVELAMVIYWPIMVHASKTTKGSEKYLLVSGVSHLEDKHGGSSKHGKYRCDVRSVFTNRKSQRLPSIFAVER